MDVVYTDFKKAFDSVNHSILQNKLVAFGFHGRLLRWVGSYLTGRSQVIRVRVSSGVPQGSHLGPLLFCIFINDLADSFEFATPLFYADDLKLFARINSVDDALNLQRDLDRLSIWCTDNKLSLNLAKCHVLRISRSLGTIIFAYSLNTIRLSCIESVRDLGVSYNSAFSFAIHVNKVTNAAAKQLGFIIRHSQGFNNRRTFKLLYDALVRPFLEYASVIWSPHQVYLLSALERVQHSFCVLLRFASGNLCIDLTTIMGRYYSNFSTGKLTAPNYWEQFPLAYCLGRCVAVRCFRLSFTGLIFT